MSGGPRTLHTEVERSVAVLPDAPEHWTYSSLKEVETCALRYALSSASYPDLWEGYGYPRAVHMSALFGDLVHDALDRIVRALVAAGCESASTPEAVAVLRSLGGYSAVATEALEQRLLKLEGNPRLNGSRREQIQRQLEDRVPEARSEVQARLCRVSLAPRPSRSAVLGSAPQTGGHVRTALGPGTYSEVSLRADELRIKGRLDLLTITTTHAHIVDHKTGREDPSHLDQLRFYGVLWENDRAANPARTPLGELTIAYPASDVTIQAPDASELDRITDSIKVRVHAADEQVVANPPVATTGLHCQLCPVRSLCTVYWETVPEDPLEVPPNSWFDIEGIVGAQNGAKSWWLLDRSGSQRVLLLRVASGKVSFERGQRLRLLSIRRDEDPEVDGIVATLTAVSEPFVVSDERARNL